MVSKFFKMIHSQHRIILWGTTVFFLILLHSCSETNSNTLFITRSANETGIAFENKLTPTPELNILNYIYYYNGAGVASGDFNNDGYIDLYFTANQAADKLYLNKGDLKFQDITKAAGISNQSNWTTGVTTVDINQDGFLDIYVCRLGDFNNVQGKNLLFVNNGPDKNNVPSFTERASEYGLDFKGFSTHATFFDYDLDGDLDVYLLNHSVNPNQNYGSGNKRHLPDGKSGDKLFENVSGSYVDVSEKAGIIQSKIGYGLGVSVSDLNNDGYPDIYVGNDFYENDYLYINLGDKTFEEIIHKGNNAVGHTTHFSMGNDIADLNNDGLTDIVSVDMLPEDIETYKTSGTEFNYQIYQNYIKNGYAHQYMHNTLQFNNGNNTFSETAFLSGIAATEWSWSPLVADLDNDGLNDIFITNGIVGATNDMDFINFIANEEIQKTLGQGMDEKDMEFIKKIPEKKTVNYFFRNTGGQQFEDVSAQWGSTEPTFSNGATYCDLDNDGDLDLVINNTNQPAMVMENTSAGRENSNYIDIKLVGKKGNNSGIGAKVILYADTLQLLREHYTSRGYLSAVRPGIHLGVGKRTTVDSLLVIWPDRSYQLLQDLAVNTTHKIVQEQASGDYYSDIKEKKVFWLTNTPPLFDFKHQENNALEFNRDPLIPYGTSNEGPAISVADINNDGLDDIFIGGAKNQPSRLFVQDKSGGFSSQQEDLFDLDKISEDVDHVFFDADGDGDNDLLVVSGGSEFRKGVPIFPRLYFNDSGVLKKDSVNFNIPVNASSVAAVDIDNDKDKDIVITSGAVPQQFGENPKQYIFRNDGNGSFEEITNSFAPQFSEIGNCNSQTWTDLNGDSLPDLIVSGDWMPITIFINTGEQLEIQKNNGLDDTHGFWNVVKAADMDNDGDLDLIAGNWGINTRLKASPQEPIRLYRMDADDNHNIETIVTYYYQGEETTLASKDELVKQLPGINKKYLSYADFANAKIDMIFPKDKLHSAFKREVYTLESSYFENLGDNTFRRHSLPFKAQVSSVNDIAVYDFNNDGKKDLLLVGNNFEISTQLSRLDASHGLLLLNDSNGNFKASSNRFFDIAGACRSIEFLNYQDEKYLVITRNNDQPVFLKINK